jgi:hypothetical protein
MNSEGQIIWWAKMILPSSLKPTLPHPGPVRRSADSHRPAASDTHSLCHMGGVDLPSSIGSHLWLLVRNPYQTSKSLFASAETTTSLSGGASLGMSATHLLIGCLRAD